LPALTKTTKIIEREKSIAELYYNGCITEIEIQKNPSLCILNVGITVIEYKNKVKVMKMVSYSRK
jgi:hypothetical protein